jgi:hypothetical protein
MTPTLQECDGVAVAPSPVPTRKLLHTRRVTCEGFARSDGLYDIEAQLQDISPDGSNMIFKILGPGEAIHRMRMVMTIDSDLLIHDFQARTEAGPTPECLDVSRFYAVLKGVRIGRGGDGCRNCSAVTRAART